MPAQPALPARLEYHHGNLRRALLDAALALFQERQRFDFTMRELARQAGVTHNAPYRHFESRWALLDALAAEGFTRMGDYFERAAPSDAMDPRTRIAKLGEAYVRFAAENPDHFRLMWMRPLEAASVELGVVARASYKTLEGAIADAKERGVLRPELSTVDAVMAAWSLVHGLASLIVGGQVRYSPRSLARRMDAMSRVFAEGAFVKPRRGRSKGGAASDERA